MKLTIFTLLFIFCSHFLTAQFTNIPDPNFEQALINWGLDSGLPDGQVPTSAIDTLTRLLAGGQNISDLTGIQDFTALERITIVDNELTSLDLSQNLNLTFLQCSSNQLTSIDISQNIALEILLVSDNQLSNIDVSQNTALIQFQCGKNLLTEFDISQNTALIQLRCDKNLLTELDVSQNLILEDLSCGDNLLLEELDVTHNLELENLLINSNPILEIDLTANKNLRSFQCSYSDIEKIDVSHNDSLQLLACNETKITEIDVTHNENLKNLNIRSNAIDSIDLVNNHQLKHLYIAQCELSDLNLFHNPNLEILWCQFNNITHLNLSQNPLMKEIICAENNLNCLNVKNGNNQQVEYFKAFSNPSLTCIEVDDPDSSSVNWTEIDVTSTFSNDCDYWCLENKVDNENIFENLTFQCFPNPTSGNINIIADKNYKNLVVKVYNLSGQELMSKKYKNTQNIDFELEASSGIYFITIEAEGSIFQRFKIIKN